MADVKSNNSSIPWQTDCWFWTLLNTVVKR